MAAAEQLVAPTETSYLYMSRRADLRLVRIPRYPIFAGGGRQVGEEPGQMLQFIENTLRVPKDGKVMLADGRRVDSGEILQWLDSHRRYGDVEDGFWRVDPTAPPVSQDELDRLLDAALNYDQDLLEEIVRQERAGWGRSQIIESAERSLAKIREMEVLAAQEQAKAAKKA